MKKMINPILNALRKIAQQSPALMHDNHQCEVLVYPASFNPCKIASDAVRDDFIEVGKILSAPLDFGDYCTIEQKRYGAENEFYRYKVIGRGQSNYYRKVPVDARDSDNAMGDICDVVKVICCGVCEEKVETFRLQDVLAAPRKLWWHKQ